MGCSNLCQDSKTSKAGERETGELQEEVAENSMEALLPTDVFSWHLPSGLGPVPTEDEVGLGYSQAHSPEQGRSLCLGVRAPRQRVPSSAVEHQVLNDSI